MFIGGTKEGEQKLCQPNKDIRGPFIHYTLMTNSILNKDPLCAKGLKKGDIAL